MKYVEAPSAENFEHGVFLAGGITGCPDWQTEMVRILSRWDLDLAILNPRRANFPIGDPLAAQAQIAWEFEHLRSAEAISFWFPQETLNPIVLYELGAWSMTKKPIFVGVHPDYKRRQDVEIQTGLARPDVTVVYYLEDLAKQVVVWTQRK